MLSAINPIFNKFGYRKGRELISEIYSVIDETFGLLVIYNEHHVRKEQEIMKQNERKGTTIKKGSDCVQERVGTNREGQMLV